MTAHSLLYTLTQDWEVRMKVSDVMTIKVHSISPQTPVRDIWKAIFKEKLNALPVIDAKKKLVGIISKDDLLHKLYPEYSEFIDDFTSAMDYEKMEQRMKDILSYTAKDVMSTRVIFARHDTPALRALSRMIARNVNQLPVISVEETVIGMITKGDVFYALFKNQTGTEKNDTGEQKKELKSIPKKRSYAKKR